MGRLPILVTAHRLYYRLIQWVRRVVLRRSAAVRVSANDAAKGLAYMLSGMITYAVIKEITDNVMLQVSRTRWEKMTRKEAHRAHLLAYCRMHWFAPIAWLAAGWRTLSVDRRRAQRVNTRSIVGVVPVVAALVVMMWALGQVSGVKRNKGE